MGGRTASVPTILQQLEQLERKGTEVLAQQTTIVDAQDREVAVALVHPGKAELQEFYEKAFSSVPRRYQGRPIPLGLQSPHSGILSFLHDQLVVRSILYEAPLLEHEDAITEPGGS